MASQTCQSVTKVPDSELVCLYCGRADNQKNMFIDRTKRTKKGLVIRFAYHRKCKKEAKDAYDMAQEMSIEMTDDFATPAPTPMAVPTQRLSLFKRLIAD